MPTSLGNALGTTTRKEMEAAATPGVVTYRYTKEDGSGSLLLETGDYYLLETSP